MEPEPELQKNYQNKNEEYDNKLGKSLAKNKMSAIDSELQGKKLLNLSTNKDIFDYNYDKRNPKLLASSIAALDRNISCISYVPSLSSHIEDPQESKSTNDIDTAVITLEDECGPEEESDAEDGDQMTNEEGKIQRSKTTRGKSCRHLINAELHDKNIPNTSNHRDFIGFNYDENNPKIFVSSIATPARRRSSIAYGPKLEPYINSRRKSSIALVAHITALEEYKKELEPDAETSGQTRNILMLLKDKRMFLYCLVQVMYTLAYYVPMIYLPEMMKKDHGISKEWAGTILSVLGFGNMAGAILTGLIVQYLTISPIVLSAASLGILGIGCFGFTFCYTYEHFVIVAVAYGPMLAAMAVLMPLIVIEIFGEEKSKDAFGLVMIGKMLGAILGPPIGGYIKEYSATYIVPFYAAGTFHLIGSFLNVLMCLFHVNVKVFLSEEKYEVSNP